MTNPRVHTIKFLTFFLNKFLTFLPKPKLICLFPENGIDMSDPIEEEKIIFRSET